MPFTCPFCQHEGPPIVRKEMSSGGWTLFVVLLIFFFPLCWLPFVAGKQEVRTCASCGSTLG